MDSASRKIFEDFLLKRLEGKKAELPPSFKDLPYEEKIALNQKLAALKVVEEVLSRLPQIDSTAHQQIFKKPEKEVKKTIGGCKILRLLGQGGMGMVYLAFQEKLNREVALKVLRSFASENDSLVRRFKRESQIIAKLDNKNIVPVYDIGKEEDSFYIIMKYVVGVPLSTLIDRIQQRDRSKLSMADLEEIVSEEFPSGQKITVKLPGKNPTEFFCGLVVKVAKALEYAHQQGIIHRDVKPSNIMIQSDGEPILLDFGLGRAEGEQSRTLSGEFLGTPVYSAPESFQSSDPQKIRLLDVYSLGATLYELLTGGLPYPGDSIYEVYSNVKNKEPLNPKSYWRELPQDLSTVVLKAIQKDPNIRYDSMQAFREDLVRFLNYQPILAKPPRLIHRIRFFLKRNRYKALAYGIAPILILSLGYGLIVSRALKQTKKQEAFYKELSEFDEIRREEARTVFAQVYQMNANAAEGIIEWTEGKLTPGENPQKTIQEINEKLKANRNDVELLESLAEIYLAMKDYQKAEAVGEEILNLDPKNFSAYILLANATILHGDNEKKAAELVYRFNKYYPNEVGANALLGTRCLVEQHYPCAIEFIGLAAQQNPKKFSKILGLAYMANGNYLKAVQFLKEALQYYPEDPKLYDGLAIAYGKLDRFKEALKNAEQGVQLESGNEARDRMLNSLRAHLAQQNSGMQK